MKRLRVAGKLGHGWEACVLGRLSMAGKLVWLGSLSVRQTVRQTGKPVYLEP